MNEKFTAVPTAEEYALFREFYAQTYPVRPLMNAIDAKDAEITRLRSTLLRYAQHDPTCHVINARLRGNWNNIPEKDLCSCGLQKAMSDG